MRRIIRDKLLLNKIVIVDGQPGCGKTMLSPIISSLKNVELITYIFELEFLHRTFEFKGISKDSLITLSRMLVDHKLYQLMMGRETNFRYDDISSVFNNHDPKKYFNRIFDKGDETIPKKIIQNKPILNVASHDMISYVDLLFETFGNKLIFIEVIRHPLYMLIQQTENMKNLIGNARDIDIYFKYKGKSLPYFAKGWENIYCLSNPVERAIYNMYYNIKKYNLIKRKIKKKYLNFISIPFESFVIKPNEYVKILLKKIDTKKTKFTKKILAKHNIPRKKIADSIELDIYKKFGWKSSVDGLTEKEELMLRKNFAVREGARPKFIDILDKISLNYEKEYFNNIK